MTTAPIPFTPNQATGLEELSGAGVISTNICLEPGGAIRKRPGITTHAAAPQETVDAAGLSGLYISETNGDIYAVGASGAERPIYRIAGGSALAIGGGAVPNGLRGALRPVFAETEAILVLAGGGAIQRVELATYSSNRLGGSPPVASHVIANASRLLANNIVDFTSQIAYSDVAGGKADYSGNETWTPGIGNTAGFFTAEARPDPLVAIHENTGEVFAFGRSTLQVFTPDESLTYAPVGTREVGCCAPYSVVKVDQAFFWLDNFNRFVRSDGRGFDVISDPISRTLDAIDTVSDCYGFRVNLGFMDAIVWTFPSDGRTFVYQKGIGWSQWTGWDVTTDNWGIFPGVAVAKSATQRSVLVATTDGHVGQLSFDAKTDLGKPIKASVTTGYVSHGTDKRKQNLNVRFTFRRGDTLSLTAAKALLRFRDRPGAWSDPIEIDLGVSGDTEPVVVFYSLGVYRRRQWNFEFIDDSDLSMVSAVEEFEVLDL